jgi:hypothetical protein
MPSPYLTYALAALSFGLAVAFSCISDENSALTQAKIAVEMRLETAEGEAKAFREKYTTEEKAREFAEAAQTLAETSERAVRTQLTHETKARQAAEKSVEEAESARRSVEAALTDAQEQVRVLNAKLVEASAAKEQSERKSDAIASDRGDAADAKEPAARSGDGSPAASAVPAEATVAQASMTGSRPWYSFLGLF